MRRIVMAAARKSAPCHVKKWEGVAPMRSRSRSLAVQRLPQHLQVHHCACTHRIDKGKCLTMTSASPGHPSMIRVSHCTP